LDQVVNIIATLGFPIGACLLLGWFIYKIYKNTTAENKSNMEAVQNRCKEREEKLYEQLRECREINTKAMNVLGQYVEKLDHIQSDVEEIKHDITVITEHIR
jgi:hypothetical protein